MSNKKKIMIVEDDSFVMDIYETKLMQAGFEVIEANNGMEALKKLEQEENIPDLMLLDIIMPYMDGLELLRKIKQEDKLKNIPVILRGRLPEPDLEKI